MYAIDLLKQLAMKFLEKDEHANYHFQKEFLKPFETIMANNQSAKIRDLLIRCLSNMIVSKSHNIKSGWKSILVVCSIAAGDRDGTILHMKH
jgi:brefeldin A-inhibited guanine nucleotide-exchange protein